MYYKNIYNDIQKAAHNPEKPPSSKNNTTIANQTHTPEKNKLKKKINEYIIGTKSTYSKVLFKLS